MYKRQKVTRTKKKAGIPVGDAYLGRIINALGAPIDGKGEIKADAVSYTHLDVYKRQVPGVSEVVVSLEDKNAVVTAEESVGADALKAAVEMCIRDRRKTGTVYGEKMSDKK